MASPKKKNFFDRLTGGIRLEDDEFDTPKSKQTKEHEYTTEPEKSVTISPRDVPVSHSNEDEQDDFQVGQLSIDVYETPTEIVIQTMVAAVRPEDLQITITRDEVVIRGKREENKSIRQDNYFVKELYWGTFSRTVKLPHEVEPDLADAIEKHGLLIVKLPKIDKSKHATIRVKSL